MVIFDWVVWLLFIIWIFVGEGKVRFVWFVRMFIFLFYLNMFMFLLYNKCIRFVYKNLKLCCNLRYYKIYCKFNCLEVG